MSSEASTEGRQGEEGWLGMHPNHLNFDDWDSHALFSALSNLFSVLYSVPARLPVCLGVFFLKDVSLLQMIGDTRTKEYGAAVLGLSDR